MCDTHEEEVKALMVKLLRVINANDGEVKPDVAMPALLYTTGFVLGHAGHGVPLNVLYSQVISDIEHARSITASSLEMQDVIERMKEGA